MPLVLAQSISAAHYCSTVPKRACIQKSALRQESLGCQDRKCDRVSIKKEGKEGRGAAHQLSCLPVGSLPGTGQVGAALGEAVLPCVGPGSCVTQEVTGTITPASPPRMAQADMERSLIAVILK